MPRRSRSSSRSSRESRSRSSSSEVEGVRVYVGELPAGCSENELEHIFKKYGPLVEVWMAKIPPCFAFIVFRDREDADEAVRAMNGRTICGRRVRVSIARPRVEHRSPRRAVSYSGDARCYQCGERGHLSRNCHVSRSRSSRTRSPRRRRRSSSSAKSSSRSRTRSRSRDRKSKKTRKSRGDSYEKSVDASADKESGDKKDKDRHSRHKSSKQSSSRREKDRDVETKEAKREKRRSRSRSGSVQSDDQKPRKVSAKSSRDVADDSS